MLLKYIVIPGTNSNKEEFIAFLNIAKKTGVTRIALDIDAIYARKHDFKANPILIEFIIWAEDYAKKQGFETETFMFFKHVLSLANQSST